jgi:hypothetical protein
MQNMGLSKNTSLTTAIEIAWWFLSFSSWGNSAKPPTANGLQGARPIHGFLEYARYGTFNRAVSSTKFLF